MPTMPLPVLDMRAFRAEPSSKTALAFVRALRDACHEPGFCYVIGHGVPAEIDRELMADARRFFALPDAEREALAIANSPHFRGYTLLGDERTKNVRDWREQLDIGPEEPRVEWVDGAPAWLRLRGPNQWPPRLPTLKPTVLRWMQAMDRVGLEILRALALGLDQPMGYFDQAYLPRHDPHLKIIRYPPSPDSSGLDQGVGWHHDSGLLSFVLQDAVGGLQVQTAEGIVEATPVPGSYVLNLGEMLQIATNGYLRATPHRVKSPPAGSQRISIAYFFHPRLDAVFEPVALPAELARAARGGQNSDPNDAVLKTFGDNYLKIRLRSHPDVAQKHYSDVLARITSPS